MSKRLKIMLICILGLLLLPFIAMQFTSEVNWTVFDFTLAAVLLSATALCCDWVWRKVKNSNTKIIICAVILLLMVIVWAEMAVGIFDSPIGGN